jgi:hypothetical protein
MHIPFKQYKFTASIRKTDKLYLGIEVWFHGDNLTEQSTNLDKRNLVELDYGGLVLGTGQFSFSLSCLKYITYIQKWSKVT